VECEVRHLLCESHDREALVDVDAAGERETRQAAPT